MACVLGPFTFAAMEAIRAVSVPSEHNERHHSGERNIRGRRSRGMIARGRGYRTKVRLGLNLDWANLKISSITVCTVMSTSDEPNKI